MKEFWNARYSEEAFAYGKEPNRFFKYAIDEQQPRGSILLPAEGEGRNAVYAAQRGLEVSAFDISEAGKKKAMQLAASKKVKISYEVGDFFNLELINQQFDAAALIYAHFPPPILSAYHKKIGELLKPGGLIMLEGFSKNNLELRLKNPAVGGPDKLEMLFSTEMMEQHFPDFDSIILEEAEVELDEGKFHNGKARVIRFLGRKKK